jgi:ATP-dependent DNA ligase
MTIKPMLLHEVENINELDTNKIFQLKRNGIRAMMHIKNNKVIGIFNRNGAPCLNLFPELAKTNLDLKEGCLDGEVVVEKDGKDIFYGGIDHRKKI